MPKYGIILFSKHTGERVILGSQFATLEDRQDYVDAEVCSRCYRVEVLRIPYGMIWRDRHIGFVSEEQRCAPNINSKVNQPWSPKERLKEKFNRR